MKLCGFSLVFLACASVSASSEGQLDNVPYANDVSFLQASLAFQQTAEEAGVEYVKGVKGENGCPEGSSRIDDLQECQAAANKFSVNPPSGLFNDDELPAGCYFFDGDCNNCGNAKLNTHPVGETNQRGVALCKQGNGAGGNDGGGNNGGEATCDAPSAAQDKGTRCSSDARFDTLDKCQCAVSKLCAERPSVDSRYEGSNFWDDFCNRDVTVRDTWLDPGCGIEVLPNKQGVRPYFNTRTSGNGVHSLATPICKATVQPARITVQGCEDQRYNTEYEKCTDRCQEWGDQPSTLMADGTYNCWKIYKGVNNVVDGNDAGVFVWHEVFWGSPGWQIGWLFDGIHNGHHKILKMKYARKENCNTGGDAPLNCTTDRVGQCIEGPNSDPSAVTSYENGCKITVTQA